MEVDTGKFFFENIRMEQACIGPREYRKYSGGPPVDCLYWAPYISAT